MQVGDVVRVKDYLTYGDTGIREIDSLKGVDFNVVRVDTYCGISLRLSGLLRYSFKEEWLEVVSSIDPTAVAQIHQDFNKYVVDNIKPVEPVETDWREDYYRNRS